MQLDYPLTFDLSTLWRDYLWGGSKLKALLPTYPADQPLAELWIVSDRPDEERVGVVANGPLRGTSLRNLMTTCADELLGALQPINGRFPVLIKLLDPAQPFSLQVHPTPKVAAKLGGEAKPEFWTFLPGTAATTRLVAGLKHGVTRTMFESILRGGGDLEPLLQELRPSVGDSLYIPAGRVHSCGAGALIYEVQTNSDTTYRIFDWNRVDAKTGQPRVLHIDEALASIDFFDIEPGLESPTRRTEQGATVDTLVDTPLFTVERWTTSQQVHHEPASHQSFEIVTVIEGSASVSGGGEAVTLAQLGTTLLPASVPGYSIDPTGETVYLRTFVRT